MNRVLVIQEVMKHYRVPLYALLVDKLEEKNIALKVAYSRPKYSNISKADNVTLPECYGIIIKSLSLFNGRLILQCPFAEILKADLIIVEQANKHLINYLLLLLSVLGLKKVALWGHGKNHQSSNLKIREKLKKRMLLLPNWWFAYTQKTQSYIAEAGYDQTRITNVENSFDVGDFYHRVCRVTDKEKSEFLRGLEIPKDSVIGIYCGAMYQYKELPFLVEALTAIKQSVSNFYFIFAGAGPDAALVQKFSNKTPWCHYIGPVFHNDKAKLFARADVILNPGLVGLGVLDGLAAGLPMVSTHYAYHSPEFAYLKPGYNGAISEFSVFDYAKTVIEILTAPKTLSEMKRNSLQSKSQFSIENMARNFCQGIESALRQRH